MQVSTQEVYYEVLLGLLTIEEKERKRRKQDWAEREVEL